MSPSFRFKALNPAFQSDPRRILGQQLQQQGLSSAPVRTPLQGLGRLSSALIGAYLQKGAIDRQVARESDFQDKLTNALSGLDMSKTPFLQGLSTVAPETVLPIAAQMEMTKATKTPPETFTTLSNQQAVNAGLPVDRGQVYQVGSISKQIKPIGSTTTPSMGTAVNQLNRAIELKNKSTLSLPEQQELRGLEAILKRPQNINKINKQTGDTELIQIPGIDLNTILTGNENQVTQDTTKPDKKPIIVKQAKLNKTEAAYVSDLASATNDIKTVIDIAFNGDLQNGDYNQTVSVASGTSIGRASSGDAQRLFRALDNLSDLRLRKRTGATANPFEVTQYRDAVIPGITTRADTFRSNIERLITELASQVNSFKQGRNIQGLPQINLNDYLKKSEQKTNSNLVNLPDK